MKILVTMRKLAFCLLLLFSFITTSKVFGQNNVIDVKYKYNDDKTVDISYVKHLPGSYYVELTFSMLDNCSNSGVKRVIKSRSGNLVRLKPVDPKKSIGFSYSYNYIYGNPKPKIDEKFQYVLPFKSGKTIDVIETVDLRETRFKGKKEKTWKSFLVERDFADTVCNMRKGVVTKIIDKYDEHPSDDYVYTSAMNSITIEHKDGTFSKYNGLNKDLIFVKLGQEVYPQTPLGVLSKFNNSAYRLYFGVAYLKPVNDKVFKQRTFDDERLLGFLNPFFYTNEGIVQLNNRQTYTSDMNDEVFFKEFSRREKKQYKKHPERFK